MEHGKVGVGTTSTTRARWIGYRFLPNFMVFSPKFILWYYERIPYVSHTYFVLYLRYCSHGLNCVNTDGIRRIRRNQRAITSSGILIFTKYA